MRGILFLCLSAAAALAQNVDHWTASQLKAAEKTLAPKMNAQKIASQQLANYGNHSGMLVHREADGEAEVHETMADLFVVQTGEGTLVTGGEVVSPRKTGAGEIRGPSIKGGARKKIGPGDIVHIPARTPHQTLVPAGKQITYFILKVESK
ncbi:MAG: hypothetical protein HYS04_15245 [Acidobacteria bacterium]|nr:hypothetical protein [Acidobacteriota bacterium]